MVTPYGWFAAVGRLSASGKWLNEILVRDKVHDGAKMTGSAYRVPCKPLAPGTQVADADLCIIHSMPVKSLITFPQSGIQHRISEPLELRGHAWAGDHQVNAMAVSIDFGATWSNCDVQAPKIVSPGNDGQPTFAFRNPATMKFGRAPQTTKAAASPW